MSKKIVNTKLKTAALILNILQLLAFLGVEAIVYKYVSYKNYLVLDYMPMKYVIIFEVVMAVLVVIPFLLRGGKKRTIISIVYSTIMFIGIITVIISSFVFDKQIKNVIAKADNTLQKIEDNSKLSTDEYGVYVLKTDTAKEIEDVSSYKFGTNSAYASDDTNAVVENIQLKLQQDIKVKDYKDSVKLADGLLNGKTKAIILNQTMIDLIESAGDDNDNGKSDGKYSKFSDNIKCIYTVNIKNELDKQSDSANVTKENFVVYLSGIDTEGLITTKSRSDVNIIMSVNPVSHNIVLISTPRDYYVPLSISNGVRDKLTHAGIYGIDVSMKTLDMLYGIDIKYYVRINFTGFVDVIDALGGISVKSDYSFSTHGYSYSEGLNEGLSGIEALWFARERHAFADGDRQRGRDQMKVIEALVKKFQSTSLLKNYDEILNDVSNSFQTNMSKESIAKLVKMQLNDSPKWKITTYSTTGAGESNYTYSVPSARAYVMVPDEDSITEAKKLLSENKYGKKIDTPATEKNEAN